MKICVDPGHGGDDPGAVGLEPFRLAEKTFNLQLARLLEEELEWRGHWVVATRRRDRSLSLSSRAGFANRLGADFFLSLHANAAADPAIEGMEVLHFPGSSRGQEAAVAILEEMTASFPRHRNRGLKQGNWAVLRLTTMPAVIVECEFLTNPAQLRFLDDLANQLELAEAIAEGVEALGW